MNCITNGQEIINRIKDYKYVSFDLFDTLVKRDVYAPSDVFRIIEAKGNPGFCKARMNAERIARKNKYGNEVTIDDIYSRLDEKYSLCKEQEVELEIQLCTCNLELKKVFDFCIQTGINVLITSDIYLHKDTIEEILRHCNYKNYKHLFVSSEYSCMKANGKLYLTVLKTVNIAPSQLLHIGDNEISDFAIPTKIGIDAILISRNVFNLQYAKYKNRDTFFNYWIAFTNNRIDRGMDYFYRTGYEVFGPLLYGFIKWLLDEVVSNGIEKVFFLSRDGQIIKKAFDRISKGTIKSSYLYVSRKALLSPSLKLYKNVDVFKNSCHFPYKFTAEKLCQMIGCENKNTIDEIITETKSKNCVFYRDSIYKNKPFDDIYYCTQEKLSNYVNSQFDLFRDYLDEMNFHGKVAVVDIGWHGNMQKNLMSLAEAYKSDCNISGYYVAMIPSKALNDRQDMKGFLFDGSHNQKFYPQEQLINAVFELLFTGDHGTVLGYKKTGKTVKPRLGTYEIDDNESLAIINNYQSGALQFCEDANATSFFDPPSSEYISNIIFKQFITPNLKDAKKWGNITFEDYGRKKLVTFKSIRYYAFHFISLIHDYRNTIWKVGFLKQLLRGNLNYGKILFSLSLIKRLLRRS